MVYVKNVNPIFITIGYWRPCDEKWFVFRVSSINVVVLLVYSQNLCTAGLDFPIMLKISRRFYFFYNNYLYYKKIPTLRNSNQANLSARFNQIWFTRLFAC